MNMAKNKITTAEYQRRWLEYVYPSSKGIKGIFYRICLFFRKLFRELFRKKNQFCF